MNSKIILANVNQLVQISNAEAYFFEPILISRPFRQDEHLAYFTNIGSSSQKE